MTIDPTCTCMIFFQPSPVTLFTLFFCGRAEAGKQVLSNALEVYVNDPVVDWLKGPLDKDASSANPDSESSDNSGTSGKSYATLRDDVTWEPRRRIANAVRKMEGVHPVALMVEDLQVCGYIALYNLLLFFPFSKNCVY